MSNYLIIILLLAIAFDPKDIFGCLCKRFRTRALFVTENGDTISFIKIGFLKITSSKQFLIRRKRL